MRNKSVVLDEAEDIFATPESEQSQWDGDRDNDEDFVADDEEPTSALDPRAQPKLMLGKRDDDPLEDRWGAHRVNSKEVKRQYSTAHIDKMCFRTRSRCSRIQYAYSRSFFR